MAHYVMIVLRWQEMGVSKLTGMSWKETTKIKMQSKMPISITVMILTISVSGETGEIV